MSMVKNHAGKHTYPMECIVPGCDGREWPAGWTQCWGREVDRGMVVAAVAVKVALVVTHTREPVAKEITQHTRLIPTLY